MTTALAHLRHRRQSLSYVEMCLVLFLLMVLPATANPILESTGNITVDWDAGAITLDSTLTAGWTSDAMQADITLLLDQTGIDQLDASFVASLGDGLSLAGETTFDPHDATFTQARFGVTLPLMDVALSLQRVLEPGALGSKVELTSSGETVIQSLSLGFNLDRFGTIQTSSCASPFTYAETRFSLPLACCDSSVTGSIRFDCAGFSELSLSAPNVGGLPFGVTFGAFLTFTTQEKTLQMWPSFNLENPDCFDFYTGLVWDANTRTISGIRFYGMGMRCEIGDIRIRMLYSFDPATLALIKSPYKALLGIVWPMVGCCNHPGEGSVAFFFGENNLFDLEEIVGELVAPVTESLSLSLLVEYPMAGLPTFTFGWKLSL